MPDPGPDARYHLVQTLCELLLRPGEGMVQALGAEKRDALDVRRVVLAGINMVIVLQTILLPVEEEPVFPRLVSLPFHIVRHQRQKIPHLLFAALQGVVGEAGAGHKVGHGVGQRRQLPILALSGQQLPADRAVDGGGSEHLARQRLLFHKLILGVRQPEQGLERAVLPPKAAVHRLIVFQLFQLVDILVVRGKIRQDQPDRVVPAVQGQGLFLVL